MYHPKQEKNKSSDTNKMTDKQYQFKLFKDIIIETCTIYGKKLEEKQQDADTHPDLIPKCF
jgi:hypothetical protein